MKEIIAVISALFIIFAVLSFANSPDTRDENTIEKNTTTVDTTIEKYTWNTYQSSDIIFNGDSILLDGVGAVVDGSTITIVTSGTYTVSGTLHDGQIIVDAEGTDIVTLVLNNVDITCSSSAPIYVMNADEVIIALEDGSENYVTDGSSYVYADATTEEPNAAIFSKDDLIITGTGALTVDANYNNGIQSKDDLTITGGIITVNAVNDAIKGKDSIGILDAEITIDAGGDGLQSNNDEDAEKGYILIESGTFDITSGEDGIQAETSLTIKNGNIVINSGAKGLKAGVALFINDGTFEITSSDDSIHSNGDIAIENGVIVLSSSDDGIHADSTLKINNGDIRITRSYEGLEGADVIVNGGTIDIVASDDGINGAGGTDNSGYSGFGGRQDTFAADESTITITGGTLTIEAATSGDGDGLDSNGALSISGGDIVIIVPSSYRDYSSLDASGTFSLTGGRVRALNTDGTYTELTSADGMMGGGGFPGDRHHP